MSVIKVMNIVKVRFSPRAIFGSLKNENHHRFCPQTHVHATVWLESHIGLTGGDYKKKTICSRELAKMGPAVTGA